MLETQLCGSRRRKQKRYKRTAPIGPLPSIFKITSVFIIITIIIIPHPTPLSFIVYISSPVCIFSPTH